MAFVCIRRYFFILIKTYNKSLYIYRESLYLSTVLDKFRIEALLINQNNCLTYFRQLLAVLHYNENADRKHATVNEKPVYRVTFPKFKKGGFSILPKKTPPTYGR